MGSLTKIGVYYDGSFFSHISNYYAFSHERRARLDIGGLHALIEQRVADEERIDRRLARIVDSHYFRGRRSAVNAKLYEERIFDTALMRAGVTTHYLPLQQREGREVEKGIDVLLALEALEGAYHGRYDVLALIAGDADFVPLVRKLAILGTRVLLLAVDIQHVDHTMAVRTTKTSQELVDVATYPIWLSREIDDPQRRDELDSIFLARRMLPFEPLASASYPPGPAPIVEPHEHAEHVEHRTDHHILGDDRADTASRGRGTIKALNNGYGFIAMETGGDLFFFHTNLDCDFNELHVGDTVTFVLGANQRGPCALDVAPAAASA